MERSLEVARWNSFNKAGAAIGASHPTMSRAVHRLERSLGLSLLTACESGVELTEAGAALAKRLERIDTAVASAMEAVTGRAGA
jgi:DNA-binding transcriptional LysR family regulator